MRAAGRARLTRVPLFCRHNRHTADCPICSKGTPLDTSRPVAPKPRRRSSGSSGRRKAPAATYAGVYATAGPYEDGDTSYEVRLERVPGGLRLAEWSGGSIRRRAPELAAADLPGVLASARECGVVEGADAEALAEVTAAPAAAGVSRGRAGELKEELRVEPVEDERVRIARWILRPGSGWELQQAPVMLPAARYAEALAACR